MEFSALLPRTEAPPLTVMAQGARVDTAPDPEAEPPSALPTPARDCLVLLAEDNDINALVAANFLEIIGADMVRVSNGEEAVRVALQTPRRPDLVLMDCHMPGLDGYEATRAIRLQESQQGLPRLPIVALTATASDAERRDCMSAGMDDYLSKPCTLEALGRVIGQWAGACQPVVAALGEPTPGAASAAPQADELAQASQAARPQTPAYPDARCRA